MVEEGCSGKVASRSLHSLVGSRVVRLEIWVQKGVLRADMEKIVNKIKMIKRLRVLKIRVETAECLQMAIELLEP